MSQQIGWVAWLGAVLVASAPMTGQPRPASDVSVLIAHGKQLAAGRLDEAEAAATWALVA